MAVTIATGVNTDGRREVLGMSIGASERKRSGANSCAAWRAAGLRGVKLVVSDAHEGLKAAISKVLHATLAAVVACMRMRNLLAYAGRQGRGVVAAFIGHRLRPGRCRKVLARNGARLLTSCAPKAAYPFGEHRGEVRRPWRVTAS
ncbi:MAG: transposase [Rhodospirillales bacterium]